MNLIGTAIVVIALYLLPSLIALARGHRNMRALLAFNVLGGWTGFGWILALVWAAYRDPSSYPSIWSRPVG